MSSNCRFPNSIWMAIILLLCGSLAAFAQTAQITGRVTDATGAVISGVEIVVKSVATGGIRSTLTNEVGYYAVPLLQPGLYEVTARHQGFRAVTQSGVSLAVDQRAEIGFTLEVGTISERIEVRSTSLQLNTVEASQGQVIENQRIVELPLNGRNYLELALLSPGTAQPAPGSRLGGFSSGGQRISQNNYLLDGVDNNSIELAAAGRRAEMVQPSIDALQEFKVQTNAYSAEYGRGMGSVVNVTIKSGSNELHGTAFEFLRNEKLDAMNFFTPQGAKKPTFKRNQFGFSVGGPILIPKLYKGSDRTFFFADYEGTRIRETSTIVSTIPTVKMRSGDFSDLLDQRRKSILDPAANNNAFPGNIIPASRLDPVGLTLIKLYPAPLISSVASNFTHLSPRRQDVDRWDVRLDHNFRSQDSMFWRLSKQDQNVPDTPNLPPPAFGGGNYDWITQGYNTAAGWSHTFTANLVGSVRGAWNFTLFKRDNPAATNGELLNAKYGIRGGNSSVPGGFSQISPSGYRAVGIGGFNPVDRDSQNRQIVGDLTWVRGRHTLKTGANFLRSQNNIYNIRNEVGNYGFDSRFTGDGAADLLLGMASSWTWNTPVHVQLRAWNIGFFLQDDWKLTPRLTLNLGARYEVVLPWLDKYDKMGIFDIDTDPARPKLIYAGSQGKDRFNRAMIGTDTNNLMPRVGLAYKISDQTVVRAGYGMFYSYIEPTGDTEFLIGNPPFAYGVSLAAGGGAPAVRMAAGPPAGSTELTKATGLQFSSYQRFPKLSAAHQWNLNIQRQLAADWLFEAGYAGMRGLHIVRQYEGNFSPPGPGAINAKRLYRQLEIPGTGVTASPLGEVYSHRFDGNATYHALMSKLEKRFSMGFTVLVSYTFSKSIGDTCGGSAQGNTAGCGYQDLRNLRLEKALDNQDSPHRFITSALYDLPFGRARHWGASLPGPVNAIFGGWTLGSIVFGSSGLPFSAVTQGNPANTGSIVVVNRPDIVGDIHAGTRSVERDFNTEAFARNQAFQIGNAGRNILRQRSFFNWDFSALKNFNLVERLRLQFRFEAFHFSNTPRFGPANNTVGTSAFGQITGADTPRNLQFGLKLIW